MKQKGLCDKFLIILKKYSFPIIIISENIEVLYSEDEDYLMENNASSQCPIAVPVNNENISINMSPLINR